MQICFWNSFSSSRKVAKLVRNHLSMCAFEILLSKVRFVFIWFMTKSPSVWKMIKHQDMSISIRMKLKLAVRNLLHVEQIIVACSRRSCVDKCRYKTIPYRKCQMKWVKERIDPSSPQNTHVDFRSRCRHKDSIIFLIYWKNLIISSEKKTRIFFIEKKKENTRT